MTSIFIPITFLFRRKYRSKRSKWVHIEASESTKPKFNTTDDKETLHELYEYPLRRTNIRESSNPQDNSGNCTWVYLLIIYLPTEVASPSSLHRHLWWKSMKPASSAWCSWINLCWSSTTSWIYKYMQQVTMLAKKYYFQSRWQRKWIISNSINWLFMSV